jgi:hypothetical protein
VIVLRAGGELSNRINLMLPVQSWPQKYFDSLQTQITSLSIPFRPDRGRIAIVTDAGRNAMDADGAADDGAKSGRRSRVVLTPQWLASSRRSYLLATVTRKPDHRGEREGNR